MTPADLQIPERGSAPVEDPAVVAAREAAEAEAAFNAVPGKTPADEDTPLFKAAQERMEAADAAFADAPITSAAGALAKMRAIVDIGTVDRNLAHLETRHFNSVLAFLQAVAGGKAPAIGDHPDAEIIDLWRQWNAKRVELDRNTEEWRAARKKLPEWVYSDAPGAMGWPEIDITEPPWNDALLPWTHPKRPSLADVLKAKRRYADFGEKAGGAELRGEILALGRARVRAWVARVREQRAFKDRAGYTAIEAKGDALCDQLFEIEDRIEQVLVKSPAGVGIKIRLHAFAETGAFTVEAAVEEADEILRVIIRDLDRMAGAS